MQALIDVTNVPDLTATSYSATAGLTVGASVSLADVITLCHQYDAMSPLYTNDPTTEKVATATSSFSALARHLLRVAHHQVCGMEAVVAFALCGSFCSLRSIPCEMRSCSCWLCSLNVALLFTSDSPRHIALSVLLCCRSVLSAPGRAT